MSGETKQQMEPQTAFIKDVQANIDGYKILDI
jgi:hypothetical protein